MLDWLDLYPGATWQERWEATGAETAIGQDWRPGVLADLQAAGRPDRAQAKLASLLGAGLAQLIGADVLRPALPWLLTAVAPVRMAGEMEQVRDPEGVGLLRSLRAACVVSDATFRPAVERIAVIMAAKGGCVYDITPGDCVELLERCAELFPGRAARRHSPFFYELLHRAGAFPAGAPPTVRMISTRFPGQLTPEQLVRPLRPCLPSRPRSARGLPTRAAGRR